MIIPVTLATTAIKTTKTVINVVQKLQKNKIE